MPVVEMDHLSEQMCMSDNADLEKRLFAAALYELRLLLSSYVNPDDRTALGSAAWIAYRLHNQALATLAGQPFDVESALDGLQKLEPVLGKERMQQFRCAVFNEI